MPPNDIAHVIQLAIAPVFLAYGSFYSMNVFDVLLWTAAVRAFMEALERPRPLPRLSASWACRRSAR